jgi:hypothetical protein
LKPLQYAALAAGAGGLPPIFLSSACHLICATLEVATILTLRAGELFYRSQLAAIHESALLVADAEVIEAQRRITRHAFVTAGGLLQPKPFAEMDVMDDENAWLGRVRTRMRGHEHRRQSEARAGLRVTSDGLATCSALPST